jgi:transposase
METVQFDQLISVGCGIDVHKDVIVATVRKSNKDYQTKSFTAFTSSLIELRDWCKTEGVTHIAMESTGIYWKPLFNILEEDFEIILVNARHIKNVPGHKTDKKDSIWISKLLLSGLLKGSFIPPQEIRELRDLVRYKKKKTQFIASEKNRMIKFLEDCNIKLSSVVSDTQGVSATKIINDIIDGKDDVIHLLTHIHGKVKADKNDITKALTGKITEHHRFMLKMIRKTIEENEKLITELEKQIDASVTKYEVELQRLQTIDGVGRDTAITLISEIGVDMNCFENEHHLASWAGLSPGTNESAGKKKSTRVIHGNKHVQSALVEAAWGATRKKEGYMKSFYHKLLIKKGAKKALVAVSHKIIKAAYHILKNGEEYKEPLLQIEKLNARNKQKNIQKSISKLMELGFSVRLTPTA